MNKSIYLSPSNQEMNVGVGNYGMEEMRMNQVADAVSRELSRHGIMIFRNMPDWNLEKIVQDSNAKKPTVHLAIHSNANDGASRGCEVFCYKYGGEGERLAKLIYEAIANITPSCDRGIKQGCNFYGNGKHMYELAYTDAPATLVEIAFHDNVDDEKWIVANIELIGVVIAKAVLKYFDVAYIENVANVQNETKTETLTTDEAIMVMVGHGLIKSPDYWSKNAVTGNVVDGDYVGFLLQRTAKKLQELEGIKT